MNRRFRTRNAAALLALGLSPSLTYAQDHHACGDDCDSYTIQVDCTALNDFGYIANVHGTLAIDNRPQPQPNVFAARGTLEIEASLLGETAPPREVEVKGTLDILGQYLSADVTSGSDLQSLSLALTQGSSAIQSVDGVEYQTECLQTQVNLPAIADLALTQTLRFEALQDGNLSVALARRRRAVGARALQRTQAITRNGRPACRTRDRALGFS